MKELDTETKTALHYGNKIIEFCLRQERCSTCPMYDTSVPDDCHFGGRPFQWRRLDLHDE